MFRLLLRLILIGIPLGLVFFVLIQFIPYGHSHTNPPVTNPVTWNSPQTQQLAMDACGDCHSNQTTWPWYSNVAPFSWLIQRDVVKGRAILNFSDYVQTPRSERMLQAVESGHMPPFYYTFKHPKSQLTAQQKQELIAGLEATFGPAGTNTTGHAAPTATPTP